MALELIDSVIPERIKKHKIFKSKSDLIFSSKNYHSYCMMEHLLRFFPEEKLVLKCVLDESNQTCLDKLMVQFESAINDDTDIICISSSFTTSDEDQVLSRINNAVDINNKALYLALPNNFKYSVDLSNYKKIRFCTINKNSLDGCLPSTDFTLTKEGFYNVNVYPVILYIEGEGVNILGGSSLATFHMSLIHERILHMTKKTKFSICKGMKTNFYFKESNKYIYKKLLSRILGRVNMFIFRNGTINFKSADYNEYYEKLCLWLMETFGILTDEVIFNTNDLSSAENIAKRIYDVIKNDL